jgi:hypothetical protein
MRRDMRAATSEMPGQHGAALLPILRPDALRCRQLASSDLAELTATDRDL